MTGVSIMKVDAELDHGPVYAMAETGIGPDDRTPELAARLAVSGADLLIRVLRGITDGSASASEQEHARATYAAKLRREEGSLDWTWSAREAYDRFRAFYPWPGITIQTEDGQALKLTDMRRSPLEGDPGTILQITPEGLTVGMNGGSVEVREVQKAGKKATAAVEYARIRGLRAGDRFP